jgi:branched-subunit amino acid transport protein
MIWLAILGSAVATFITRSLPFVTALPVRPPAFASRYLEALPVAIIAALVGPAVVAPGGSLTHGAEPLAAALVIAVVAWRRSLLAGVLIGVIGIALFRML